MRSYDRVSEREHTWIYNVYNLKHLLGLYDCERVQYQHWLEYNDNDADKCKHMILSSTTYKQMKKAAF